MYGIAVDASEKLEQHAEFRRVVLAMVRAAVHQRRQGNDSGALDSLDRIGLLVVEMDQLWH